MEKVFFLEHNDKSLYIRLYDAIVKEIEGGIIEKGFRMPSVRQLSKTMNLSRNTVESAYAQLMAEGYVYSIPKKGCYVMELDKEHLASLRKKGKKMEYPDKSRSSSHVEAAENKIYRYDFVSEYVEVDNFNMSLWKKSVQSAITDHELELYRYADPFGEKLLKEAIADFFTRTRGIHAEAEQVIIGSGSSMLLGTLASFFKERGYERFYIDDPGFNDARKVFIENDYDVRGIKTEKMILNTKELRRQERGILFASPSYQFPYGEILPVRKRLEVLKWAKETDSYIIEDDYNNELRYEGKPVPSLQGLTKDERVIYLGSFSTLLIPSIRISFLVLPLTFVEKYQKDYNHKVQTASKLEQLALADLIKSGGLAKHIRKLKTSYKQKNTKLRQLFAEHLSDISSWHVPNAGVSCILHLNQPVSIQALESLSYERNVNIKGIYAFMSENRGKTLEKNLVLNYRGIKERDLESGIKEIKELICRLY